MIYLFIFELWLALIVIALIIATKKKKLKPLRRCDISPDGLYDELAKSAKKLEHELKLKS